MADPATDGPAHPHEPHDPGLAGRLNWLRAGVLGANDGIVSTAAIVLGFAGATSDRSAIVLAGLVGLAAGAMSMAAGEYVSVSTQRDTEKAVLDLERRELAEMPEEELDELAAIYEGKGLSPELARQVAVQLTEHDALGAHAEAELGLDPDELTSPWHAAFASFVAFVCGAAIPLLGAAFAPSSWVTVIAVAVALAITGALSARLGKAPVGRAVVRNVAGGLLAMGVTHLLGGLAGGVIG
ncbi:VIT family protein [Nakamurella flava]|uniref:VIT family protein n=1 Tax=Nakamurella flava TaxID=2576308 RepID=A0A4U6QP96_9ACTN|nr:VIT family protein [Nakamurella flava]